MMPETDYPSRKPRGERILRFAIVADTHCNQTDFASSSEFASAVTHNARARRVVAELNAVVPAFVVHLGDTVHPIPSDSSFETATARFQDIFSRLDCPLHLTPGNHDVGDKSSDCQPAPSIDAGTLDRYRTTHGRDFYSVDAGACRLLITNAQLWNSGLQAEAEQRSWLERELRGDRHQRIFLFTHYPIFLNDPSEDAHYDNIDEPARSWLLGALAARPPEAVFAAHVHNTWYDLRGATEFYVVPSTAFVRHDYSDLFRVGPGDEFGRSDVAKLGYTIVDVYEHGHVTHIERTFGKGLEPNDAVVPTRTLVPVHTKCMGTATIGVDLRHPWTEVVSIPPNGLLDARDRKSVRNDYPLIALWEMGIRCLRIPMRDLRDPSSRSRIAELSAIGHDFVPFTVGVPSERDFSLVRAQRTCLAGWEIILSFQDPVACLREAVARIQDIDLPISLSIMHRPFDVGGPRGPYFHTLQHGFEVGSPEAIASLLEGLQTRNSVASLVFRMTCWDDIASDLPRVVAIANRHGLEAEVHLRMATNNSAVPADDPLLLSNAIAEAAFSASAHRNVRIVLDTFEDVDRGWYPRLGLVDRRYNLRLPGAVVRNVSSVLSTTQFCGSYKVFDRLENARYMACKSGPTVVVLPRRPFSTSLLPVRNGLDASVGRHVWRICLGSGVVERLDIVSRSPAGWRLSTDCRIDAPTLLTGEEPSPGMTSFRCPI